MAHRLRLGETCKACVALARDTAKAALQTLWLRQVNTGRIRRADLEQEVFTLKKSA